MTLEPKINIHTIERRSRATENVSRGTQLKMKNKNKINLIR